ncbi:MAG: ATP-dependent zinc metalloprotease FtsH [Bacteroidaceae bacterium]|nr:ATP-dependent zinc metalloprotease FtsH [Bacteroidaceae bacterium]
MSNNKNNNKKNNPNKNKKQGPSFSLTWIYMIIAFVLGYLLLSGDSSVLSGGSSRNATYSQFKSYVEQGYASRIVVNKNEGSLQMYVEPSHIRDVFKDQKVDSGTRPYVVVQVPSADKLEDFVSEQQALENFKGEIEYRQGEDDFMHFIWSFGPLILIVLFWIFLMRRMSGGSDGGGPMGIFNVGKSRAKLFEKNDDNKVTFADVAGQEGAKLEVQEIVEFLKNPKRYTDLGGKIPKGALLVGPPGTGKTLLAKAVAGEADVPFFSMSGSDFVEMFVGVGASRVRDLFRQAKEKAPCIIFIDEIDAVGRARSRGVQMGANDERESTLNQLLTEMDGFGTNSGVIIMAATNRADILDKALLRAGRFDRQIHVELPDVSERKAIFQVHLKPIKTDSSLDIDFLARQTPGFSGADIANVCNEAALIAARNGKKAVDKDDFLAAVDRIIGGLEKKTKVMTAEEKRTIALHEAGHATISWLLQYANPLVKVTIVPRGRALGAAWYLPEERQITTREQMLDEMCATLGGRAAEELFCGQISSGAMNDLERVTKQAYSMITYMGMSDKLPNLCYYDNQEYGFQRPYSEATAQLIDEETKAMIAEQYARAKDILSKNAEGHAALAQLLVEREVIFAEDVERIFGPRPWASRTEELLQTETPAEEKPDQPETTPNP